jgi:hypothetical protein
MMVVVFGIDNPWRAQQHLRAMAARDLVRFADNGETFTNLVNQLQSVISMTHEEACTLIREEWAEHKGACLYCAALSCEVELFDAEVTDYDHAGQPTGSSNVLMCGGCIDRKETVQSETSDALRSRFDAGQIWSGRMEDIPF